MENQRASPFEKYFKSNSLCEEELRKRRREDLVVIRKQKKELLIEQRRFDQSKYIEPLAPSIASENHSFSSLLQGGSLSGDSQVIDSLIQQIKSKRGHCTSTFAVQGVISTLASLYISVNDVALQKKIAFILGNMNMLYNEEIEDEENINLLIPRLCDLIADSYAQRAVMRDLLFALSLLIGDSVVRRNEAIDSGVVGHIVHVNNLGYPDMRVTRSIMTLVAQLFQNITDFAPDPNEMHPLLPVVLSGLKINDRDARGEALRACAQMCEWSVVWRMMYEEDILAQLVMLLDQRKDLVELFYILKVIDTITQNTSMYSIYLIRFGLFRFLSCLLPIPVVGQDVCFILSNLIAEGQRLIDMIFDTGFIPQLAAVLENADCETRKEASHALCRCICFTRNSEHLRVIVDLHILQQLADLLTVMDAQLISQILDAIQCLLAYGAEHLDKYGLNLVAEELDALGVYTKLEFLTDSNVVDIHIKAFELIEVYFPSRLETMDEHVPVYGGGDNFSAPKTTVDDTIESILNCVNK